ncbi:MAG: VOC family protein [bacterium]
MMLKLDELDHVAVAVADVARSSKWYQDVLGLEQRHQESWGDYPVFLCAGSSGLALFPAGEVEAAGGREVKMKHFAFRADRANFEQAQIELKKRGVDFEFQDHDIARSIYFHDPDGYTVEITTYQIA